MAFFDRFTSSNKDGNRSNGRGTNRDIVQSVCENPNLPSHTAVIYQSELDYISRCILDYPQIETGGQLFGFWTATGTPIVAYAIGPGRNAQHLPTSFIQDQVYLQEVGNELHYRYRLQHVGEWHSHHQLGLTYPSGGDINTMQYGVGKPGFPRLLLCIGNCTHTHSTVNAFNFHENTPRDYVNAIWDVVDIESPYRRLVDLELQRMLIHPRTRRASHGQIHTVRSVIREDESIRVHWLTENVDNVETMKTFVMMVESMFSEYEVKAEILSTGEPLITVKDAKFSIKLPYDFPRKGPILLKEIGEFSTDRLSDVEWNLGEESLIDAFGRWLAVTFFPSGKSSKAKPVRCEKEGCNLEERRSLTEDEKNEYCQAEIRTKQIGYENQRLSENFHQKAFVWSEITEEPVVNIVAFPFREGRQGVIRIAMPSDFPETPPNIKYGFYDEDPTLVSSLSDHLANIDYKNLSELFRKAGEVYLDMLKWDSDRSMFKAYIIACIMLDSYDKATREDRDVMELLCPLLDDDKKLKCLTEKIEQKIKENKK